MLYHHTFRKLEEEDCLVSSFNMYCLLFVFLPRINSTLESLIDSWVISTKNNLTPNQLFIRGAIQQKKQPVLLLTATTGTPDGVAQGLPTMSDHVVISCMLFAPCPVLYRDRSNRVDSLGSSTDFGCDLYKRLLAIVCQHLQAGCTACGM